VLTFGDTAEAGAATAGEGNNASSGGRAPRVSADERRDGESAEPAETATV